ncbi:MAG: VWA domain-containing protein [Deltaproteobacteria bacterium]|nr:VWA domain-containing protein [Deltaproteobacteria bacterium]
MTPGDVPPGDRYQRWRLVLGRRAEEGLEAARGGEGPLLEGPQEALDEALATLYEPEVEEEEPEARGPRTASLGASAPRVARWLGDVRRFFDRDVVALVQRDAMASKGLKELLIEPETLGQAAPSVELAGLLLTLKDAIPEASRATARRLVAEVVEEVRRRLQAPLASQVRGALRKGRKARSGRPSDVDWARTVRKNLQHWDRERRVLIPREMVFHGRSERRREWRVLVCLDQSGSMAESVVYGAVLGSVLASLPSLETRLVVFDTAPQELEGLGGDAVDLLFGIQLGGGTDIRRAVEHCEGLVSEPSRTLFVLVSDLFEGGDAAALVRAFERLVGGGVKALCLLALSDAGTPAYDEDLARSLRALGVPCFACSPRRIPEVLAAVLGGADPLRAADAAFGR